MGKFSKDRRKFLAAGVALGAAAGAGFLRPGDKGGTHSEYFQTVSRALDDAGFSQPTLVVDRQLLSENIATLQSHMQGRFAHRIVAKSLPSVPLLEEVMRGAQSNRLMLFHQPFINQVASQMPVADVLMGKPMPAQAAAAFYRSNDESTFDSARQLQWLIDTPERLLQYRELAHALVQPLQVNIEIDVGLHRGGVDSDADLVTMLEVIEQDDLLSFSGFMGYEVHAAKLPGNKERHRDAAMAIYRQRMETAEAYLQRSIADLTLNGAGSPTYQLYDQGEYPMNELAAGSCLVKPIDFDLPTLADHQPACWIASPVLKTTSRLQLPGPNFLSRAMSAWNPNRQRSFFIYGGYWKANPVSPPGLSPNPLFGRSTNQEMLNGSEATDLAVDDWVFLRPTQSESVFLQFGDIAVYDGGEIAGRWPVFKNTG